MILAESNTLLLEQRRVTQKAGTERPSTGEYNGHKEPGIYVDILSGEPLFASSDKFGSGARSSPLLPPIVDALPDAREGGGGSLGIDSHKNAAPPRRARAFLPKSGPRPQPLRARVISRARTSS